MAGRRVELLLLAFTGTLLLLGPVQGWERINETQLLNLYKTGVWDDTASGPSPDDRIYYDDEEDITGDADLEAERFGTSDTTDLFPDHEEEGEEEDESGPRNWAGAAESDFHVEFLDTPPRGWPSTTEGDSQVEFIDAPPKGWPATTEDVLVEFVDAPPRGWPSTTDDSQVEFVHTPPRTWPGSIDPAYPGLKVVCGENGFQITMTEGLLGKVKINFPGLKDQLPVMDVPETCGYDVIRLKNTYILSVPFARCYVTENAGYSLQLFIEEFGQTQRVTVSCEFDSQASLSPRASGKASKCCKATATPAPQKAQNCAVPTGERVRCGYSGISFSDCEKKGCCVDMSRSVCYYPLDECTADQHFVFAIRHDGASVPVDPSKLVIPGHADCKPVIINDEVAIFKFKVNECGTHAYEIGEMKIYLAEVQTIVQALNLKYGIITRSDPLRFMIECRYSKCGTAKQTLASVGYMVKTPTSSLPSSIMSNGLYGVQLRIAKDQTYSSYFPTYHQPLRLLLGKPVYLELRLKSPKPDAVILVNYCLAYPRSAKNALVLIYEGCANPNDPNVSIIKVNDLPNNRHQRRIVVKAFQFMEQKTNKYLNEEIYFMCSTEVCRPTEKTCEERCFDGKVSFETGSGGPLPYMFWLSPCSTHLIPMNESSSSAEA